MYPRPLQFGHFFLSVYAIFMAVGLLIALLVALRGARLLSLDRAKIWNLALISAIAWLAGAKIVLTAARWNSMGARAWTFDLAGAPWAMACGVLVALAAGWAYGRKAGLPLRRAADALAPAIAAGSAVTWMGCFEAGYAFGIVSRHPWAVIYTSPFAASSVPLGVPLVPVQIYGSMAAFLLFALSLWWIRLPHLDGEVMGAWLFLNGLCEFFLSFVRGDAWGGDPVAGFFSGAQWVGLAMVISGGFLWLRRERRGAHRKVGATEISAG